MNSVGSDFHFIKQLIVIVSLVFIQNGVVVANNSDRKWSGFVRAESGKLVLKGQPFLLKGINFSNRYDSVIEPKELLASRHHSESDFYNVSQFGMNAVRFAFNGEWFERDQKTFFRWLDQNVQWANKAGIYLILDLHVPIGGFWLDPTSDKVNFRIWSEPDLQKRNLEMWMAIAQRYKDENGIAAYDVLNEPVTSDKDGSQWVSLAQQLVDAIRRVDKNHLIIIGKLYGTDRSYSVEGVKSQFLVDDDNVLYDFHFYEPIKYTHQYASWLPRPMKDGGSYPDEKILIPTGNQKYVTSLMQEITHDIRPGPKWNKFVLKRLEITNPKIKMGLPVLQVKGDVSGTVFFDDFKVFEHSPQGESHLIVEEPLSGLTIWDWWNWSQPQNNRRGTFRRIEDDGVNDSYSLSITDVNGAAGYSGWSSDIKWFQVKQGYSYSMTGYLKSTDPDVNAYFDIAFYGESNEATPKAFMTRNREYLEWEFRKLYQFGVENNVPVSVMEFGLTHECFTKGGERWVADVIDIFLQHHVSFAYWDYHSDRMGVYYKESGKFPGNPNQELILTFQRKLLNDNGGKIKNTANNL